MRNLICFFMLFIISIINGQTKITTPFFELNCKCKLIINESEDYSYNYVYESYLNGSVNIYYSITIYNYYTPTSNRDEIFNYVRNLQENNMDKGFSNSMFRGNRALVGEITSDTLKNEYIYFVNEDGLLYHIMITRISDHISNNSLNFENIFKPLRPKTFEDKKIDKKPSKYSIYYDNLRYEATDNFYYTQNAKSSFGVKETELVYISFGKKKDGTGIILLQKTNGDFFNKDFIFNGDLYLYLDDGSVIKCLNRKTYGYTDDTTSTLYFLTKQEIAKLKESDVSKISYSLHRYPETKNFSATNYTNLTSYSIQELFD